MSRRFLSLVLFAALALPGAGVAAAGDDGVAFDSTNAPILDVLGKARASGRMALLALCTARCAWCRVLERETFRAPAVGAALSSLLCARYDAGTEAGRIVAARYRVRGFPTVVLVDGAGDEIDRIVGYLPPDRFLAEVARIRAGDGTLRALRAAHEREPASAGPAVAYARRLVRAGDLAPAEALLSPVVDAVPGDAAAKAGALLGLAEVALAHQDAPTALERFERLIREHPDAPEAAEAWFMRVQLHAKAGDLEKALAEAQVARTRIRDDERAVALEETIFWLERQRVQATLVRWGERAQAAGDADGLHRAARAALERRLVLGTAVAWAETAVSGSGRDPLVLETWADLLFETGSAEKAVTALGEAIGKVEDAEVRLRLEEKASAYRAGMAASARMRDPGRGAELDDPSVGGGDRATGPAGPLPPPASPSGPSAPKSLPPPARPEPASPELPPRCPPPSPGRAGSPPPPLPCGTPCR